MTKTDETIICDECGKKVPADEAWYAECIYSPPLCDECLETE